MNSAHAVTELDGRFAEVDHAFCDLLQFSTAELFARTIMDVTDQEDRDKNKVLLARLIASGDNFWIEKKYVRPDGAIIPVRNHVSRVASSNGRARLVATVIDLRPQSSIEIMLDKANLRASSIREQTQSLQTVLSGSPRWANRST